MLINFASNDYLGLANEPELKTAAIEAVQRYGAGAGASRLVCSLAPHEELDEAIAVFKGTEAALSFSTGYATATGTICALLGKEDVIIVDKLVHACIVDAARLCGAKLRIFDHNDLDDLQRALEWANCREVSTKQSRTLIVTESVFSMDGDCSPLKEIVELKEKYGAWLMADEAHATGLYGPKGRGVAEALGVSERIEVQMGTLGKALGSSGGYICGSRVLVDYLVNRARTLIFSTAPVPAATAAARAGIEFVQSIAGKERRELLWTRVAQLKAALNNSETAGSEFASAIVPIMIGKEEEAMRASSRLRDAGIFVPGIRYPTVTKGQARLRVTLTAAHSEDDVRRLHAGIASLKSTRTVTTEARA
jgi:8-amino-7-oxononanoate synthase